MTTKTADKPVEFVTFACQKDVHYAKALLGSIGHFYPGHAIQVVLDDVGNQDERQIAKVPGVVIHRVESLIRTHGLELRGLLAKLNVLFLPGVSRAVVVDADTVLVGRVLDHVQVNCHLHFLNAISYERTHQLAVESFDRWAIDLSELQRRENRSLPERFVFAQGSHFFVDVDRFPIDVLRRMLPDMGLVHSPTHMLRAGDQGFWNYLANFGHEFGLVTEHSPVTVNSGTTPHMATYNKPRFFAANRQTPHAFIHYVGVSRTYLRRRHEYAAPLQWATGLYYRRFGKVAYLQDETRRLSATVCRGMKLVGKRFWKDSP